MPAVWRCADQQKAVGSAAAPDLPYNVIRSLGVLERHVPGVDLLVEHGRQFGLIVVINLMIGLCTPPVGYLIYLLANIAGEPPQRVIRESLPFLGVLLAVLLLVTYAPVLTLALPRLVFG